MNSPVLKADQVQQLMDEARGGNHVVSVDLEAQTVTSPAEIEEEIRHLFSAF